jgi:hypothetical protein
MKVTSETFCPSIRTWLTQLAARVDRGLADLERPGNDLRRPWEVARADR